VKIKNNGDLVVVVAEYWTTVEECNRMNGF